MLSDFEGYGMAIEEAKILNKNIIITNTAAKEAVNGYSKKLVLDNTENAIYDGLKKVLQKKIVFNNIESDFENEYLIEKIEKIIEE